MKVYGNRYEHNLLSQADSAYKVQKEKEHMEKKRKIKEKEKRANGIKKKLTKLLESYDEIKKKWYKDGSANMEDMIVSQDIEKSIVEIQKRSDKLYSKRTKERKEYETS